MTTIPTPTTTHSTGSMTATGAELVDTQGRFLPLRGTRLEVRAGGGLARARLVQTFANAYAEALEVTYKLPLPADGAVVGFAFVVAGERTLGTVQRKADARATFERAMIEGRTAALLEEERSSLFTQQIGNVPPGAEIEVEIEVDQPLVWLPDGAWEWRFPTVVGPRYLGAPGRTPDADRVTIPIAAAGHAIDARARLSLRIDDMLAPGSERPLSPSHALARSDQGDWEFASAEVQLDRDVVVRWRVATQQARADLLVGRGPDDDAYGLLTLVPPASVRGADRSVPRDLIFLIDVSGSMLGEPLQQARAVLEAMVDSMDERDRLEMLAFDSKVVPWKRRPVVMNARGKRAAKSWLAGLRGGGCTEMRSGLQAAMRPLGTGSLRQVVLVTDGYVGFESEIVGDVRSGLPRGCRVHTLGVGSGVNRSLTRPVARAGAGRELIVAPGEDPAPLADRLLAVTAAPQIVDVRIRGSALRKLGQARVPDLYAGAPALIPVALDPRGGELTVEGVGPDGTWRQTIRVGNAATAQAAGCCSTLFAREMVEDLEADRESAGANPSAIDAEIEQLGLRYRIATRCTSWVAVRDRVDVDPALPVRREVMPHLLPNGVDPSLLVVGEEVERSECVPPPSPAAGSMADLDESAPMAKRRSVFGSGRARPGAARREVEPPVERNGFDGSIGSDAVGGADDGMDEGIDVPFDVPLETPIEQPSREQDVSDLEVDGELTVQPDGLWIVTIDLDRPLDWQLPSGVLLEFGDAGSEDDDPTTVVVSVEGGTASGEYAAGVTLRLVLTAPATEDEPLVVRLPGLTIRIR